MAPLAVNVAPEPPEQMVAEEGLTLTVGEAATTMVCVTAVDGPEPLVPTNVTV